MNAIEWQPTDQGIRDRIINSVGENMCVEAGAGTGKTSVLVDRIVEILKRGHAPVQEVVVITFTEKAAAELSARVRRALERARTSATDAEETQRLDDALRGLNAAHIETIHAFAASLLRERPVEARLDPGFEVLSELPSQLDFEAAYSDWITEQMAQEPPPAALVDALNLGLEFRLVREAAERLNRHRDAMPLASYIATPFDLGALIAELRTGLSVFAEWEPNIVDESNMTYREFHRVRELQGQLIALSERPESALRLIADAKLPDVRSGRQGQWFPPSGVPKNALEGAKRAMAGAQATIKQAATARLVEWVEGFVGFYDERRKAEGTADFDDLLIWARNLVRDDVGVRAYFQAKYRCILVDEFQDTDPLQAEMIIRLCASEDPGADWRRAKLRPGSLFAVGDPKQSIYRFRGADITMYDDVKRDVFRGQTLEITQNFRSCASVIRWVNTSFEKLIVEDEGVQPHYIALEPHPDYTHGAVSVVRGEVVTTQGSPNATETRRAEAKALASLIAREIEAGAWIVREGETTETRPASYRDVAILVPTRTELHLYEDALMLANVPYRHEGGRTFFKRQEVRELIAILRAIDAPSDQVAVIAALRSPAFACSDEDLFLHREHWRFDYQSLPDTATGLVADSLRALRTLAGRRFELALPELVRELIDTLRLVEFAMLQHQGDQTAANLLKVIDQARAFSEARRSAGLRGFVRWLKENVTRDADETDALVSEETDDVVRIVTVHAAKGLEFGVVVFANMNTNRPDRTNIIVSREEGSRAIQMKLGKAEDGFRTPGYDEAEILEKSHAQAEQLRLLYVAATRARDQLVVPFVRVEKAERSKGDSKSLNDYLIRIKADEVPVSIDAALLPEHVGDVPALRADFEVGTEHDTRSIIETRAGWQATRAALLHGQIGLRVHTASSLKAGWEPAFSGDHEIQRGGAKDFGIAVHELLERIDLRRVEDIPALSRFVASESVLTHRISEIEMCARNVLGHDVIRRALASRTCLREVAFTAPLPAAKDGGLAEGRMDLLFVEDDQITVVDFKTDDVTVDEVAARSALYHNQALVYAWAAHRTTNLPVREVVFLYARIAQADRVPVDAAFLAEAEALLRAPAPAI